MTKHPTLYKITSTGATQMWSIQVSGSTIITEFGQVGGKIQTASDTLTQGKNIGRANETTPEQQAQAEALSQWEKKLKNKGYVQTLAAATNGAVDSNFVAGGITPMLAHSFDKQGHKIKYPAYTQPKLDGHRCIATIQNGVATLWTRTRKPITGVPHIVAALEAANLPDIVLDGELYNHAYRDRFEELTSFIKRPKPKPGHEAVQYHIYDIADSDQPFSVRLRILSNIPFPYGSPLVLVNTAHVNDEEEAMDLYQQYVNQGYEGSMLRNANSAYVNKRSYDLQKVKSMQDAEFKIVGVEEGRGKMAGKGIFVCVTHDNQEFRCKMKGTLESLEEYFNNADNYIGRQLTVQFQDLTADGIPRFPIGLRLREDV